MKQSLRKFICHFLILSIILASTTGLAANYILNDSLLSFYKNKYYKSSDISQMQEGHLGAEQLAEDLQMRVKNIEAIINTPRILRVSKKRSEKIRSYKVEIKEYEDQYRKLSVYLIFILFIIASILLYIFSHRRRSVLLKRNGFSIAYVISRFLFSEKNRTEIFEPIVADWQEEYFEALFKKEIWKARWINVRYTYSFLAAMWMKSPIGGLIEFVIKIAKP